MIINTGKVSLLYAARLSGGMQYMKKYTAFQPFHTSSKVLNNAEPDPALPLPHNVDAAETTRFSPQRSRDMSDNIMTMSHAPISTIDITTDNTMTISQDSSSLQDPHVQSYDCFGAVSLNAVMQSNVPTPFGGMHKFSHLNMPGGQWSQEYKFTSQNMHNSHYRSLRDSTRADWVTYDQNATMPVAGHSQGFRRCYSTQAKPSQPPTAVAATTGSAAPSTPTATTTPAPEQLSKKEQLKKMFKEYGATIVVFHVGISLLSLGGFYVLVSSGINMMPVMEFLGIESSAFAEKLAVGSTFVTAYAVHKVFAPLRISITLGSAPFIVRLLRSKGFLKSKIKSN
ncbi:uncharacterized protein LOC6576971 isoform X1 [Drosophila mojavensis]|uniref:Uncharacterized protein, isoform A n=1 Tax=Drosophila mojavensis TaxID=7230 RepID=B4KI96_DROMO|nr:uncharacterized protein LOC6576971 isoform X1 [Drosophila mojavensis]EDW12389.2 uncharacterized protein Dmoj_GI17654, isoform A [Drosophila mojavensis]